MRLHGGRTERGTRPGGSNLDYCGPWRLEFTLWLLGRRQQAQQLQILESIHIQLLLRNAARAEAALLPSNQESTYARERAPFKAA